LADAKLSDSGERGRSQFSGRKQLMKREIAFLALGLVGFIGSATIVVAEEPAHGDPIRLTSPGGHVRIEVSIRADGVTAIPNYRVTFNGKVVILDSPLQVELGDGKILGSNCRIETHHSAEVHDEYHQFPGKRSHIANHCSEVVISVNELGRGAGDLSRHWQLVVRAYDDGIAFRYRFPKQEGWSDLTIAAERTRFAFPSGTIGWTLPLNSFTTSFEKRYERKPISDIPGDWLLGLPLLVELPGTGWAAITEANLTDYAGMYLAHSNKDDIGVAGSNAPRPPKSEGLSPTLVSRLSPLPKEPKVAVRASLPHDSPWRVILIGEQAGKLIESDMLLNLNASPAIGDTSWITTGKTTFPWWNGYYEERVPFQPGLNTATMKHYIDFCAEAGIPYHSLDGKGDTAWYGGPIAPYGGSDITKGVDGLDLPEVLRYAKSKGVGIRLWMHWQAAKAHMAQAFPLYRQWGIQGVMIDFMDRDDQEMVNFQRELIKLAAENHLTVTFHGVGKPTGLERTFPNLLTSESVMNLEYDKWDPLGISPEHELTVVFTRMLAGPMDFHQGSLRTVTLADFKPRNEAPLIIGTPCRTLASYVVLQNHLSMVADYPTAYRGHPALSAIAAIPTTWDDTRFLAGEPGQFIVLARRNGDDWWIGAMTDRQSREITIPLKFLSTSSARAEIWRDEEAAAYHLAHEMKSVASNDTLNAKLAPAGGLLIRLSR
jgi:alpha-glucosidase